MGGADDGSGRAGPPLRHVRRGAAPACRRRGVRRWAGALPVAGQRRVTSTQGPDGRSVGDHPRLAHRHADRRAGRASARRSSTASACAPSATCCGTSRAATSRPVELTTVGDLTRGPAADRRRRDQPQRDQGATATGAPVGWPTARKPCCAPTGRACGCRTSRRSSTSPTSTRRQLAVGTKGVFTGQVSKFRDQWQLTNPKLLVLGASAEQDSEARELQESIRGLFPIYPLTKGVDSWDLQRAITFARSVLDDVPDVVPVDLRRKHRLPDARTALDWIHAPEDYAQVTSARKHYRYEEALVTQLVLARRRAFYRQLGGRPSAGDQGGLLAAFDERLPWPLTDGQREVSETVFAELARSWPMNRLLQGEVGSGKTVVAVRAMLRVIDSGGQAALLAPTEVLAQQHHRSITALLGDLAGGGMLGGAEEATTVTLLTGLDVEGAARPGDARHRLGPGRDRGRHPRPAAGEGLLRRPRARGRRRAAPVRGRAAGRARRQGADAAARARDDGDAHPAHRRDDGVRRPRGLHADRAAGRAGADPDQRRAARRAAVVDHPRLGARARGGREGSPGLRRLPADRGRPGRAGRA